MNTSQLLSFMEKCEDPLDQKVEDTFKNNRPPFDEDPEIAFRYWQMYMDIYGTPSNHMAVRAMFYHFKSSFYSDQREMARLMEVIAGLRSQLDEAKKRNVKLLSELQEYEAREQ